MAYNSSNETRTELVNIQKNNRGEFIIANIIKNNNTGNESVDIRQYYTDKDDEVRATSKGVRFNAENLYDFLSGMVKGLELNEAQELVSIIEERVIAELDSDSDEDSGSDKTAD